MSRATRLLLRILRSPYLLHPLYAILGIVLILSVGFLSLNLFTRHGSEFSLPDLRGVPLEKARELAHQHGLRIVVADSSYIITRRPGEVLAQQPMVGDKVKRNRRVFLSINAKSPMMVDMPNLVGETVRQAIVRLEQVGLQVGRIEYAPDFAFNCVLSQKFDQNPIEPGERVPKGALINLTLGDGLQEQMATAPDIIGMTLAEARSALAVASLNIGKPHFDESITTIADSLTARIYSTHPKSLRSQKMRLAAPVDVWLTLNSARIAIEKTRRDATPDEAPPLENEIDPEAL